MEVRRDDPIKYFFHTGFGSIFCVSEGVIAIGIPQNEEISGGGKNEGRKEINSAIGRKRANIINV